MVSCSPMAEWFWGHSETWVRKVLQPFYASSGRVGVPEKLKLLVWVHLGPVKAGEQRSAMLNRAEPRVELVLLPYTATCSLMLILGPCVQTSEQHIEPVHFLHPGMQSGLKGFWTHACMLSRLWFQPPKGWFLVCFLLGLALALRFGFGLVHVREDSSHSGCWCRTAARMTAGGSCVCACCVFVCVFFQLWIRRSGNRHVEKLQTISLLIFWLKSGVLVLVFLHVDDVLLMFHIHTPAVAPANTASVCGKCPWLQNTKPVDSVVDSRTFPLLFSS